MYDHFRVFRKLLAHRMLLVIVAVYLIAGIVHASTAPLLDVSDEPRHIAYVQHLADGGALPVQRLSQIQTRRGVVVDEAPWHQEGSQPPLYYALMAVLVQPFDRSDYAQIWQFNPHTQWLGRADATFGWNQMLHSERERFPWRGATLAIMVIRLVSMLFGAIAVCCTYAVARELQPDNTALAGLAASITAFNPMFLHIMGSVNNDTLATALASLALFIGARMLRRGATFKLALALGVALGCTALTKASGLALAGTVPLVVLYADWRTRGWQLARLFRLGVAIGLPVLFIAGWFYARNAVLYGEVTGTQMMAAIAGPRVVTPTLFELAGEWRGFMQAYIGLFGAVNIPMSRWIYECFQLILVVAGFGLLVEARRWRDVAFNTRVILVMLASVVLVAFVALLRWTSMTLASQGRLLFPMTVAISILLALGLERVCARFGKGARALIYGGYAVGMALLTLAAPFVFIRPAYAEPVRYASEAVLPPGIIAKELFFEDKIRWLGYRIDTPAQRVRPGDMLDVTLYWQALKPLDRDYSLFIKLFDRQDELVVGTDTYPGGGLFQTTRWRPGEIIADRYQMRIPEEVNTSLPTVLRLDVGFYDFAIGTGDEPMAQLTTQDKAGTRIGRPRTEIASLNRSAAPDVRTAHAKLQLADVLSVSVGAQTGAQLPFRIVWRATSDFAQDFTVFVQLYDASGKRLGSGDGQALDAGFTSLWWRAGDIVEDTHVIALDAGAAPLPAGRYTIRFGLYRRDGTPDRMPAFDDNGQPLQDYAVVETFELP